MTCSLCTFVICYIYIVYVFAGSIMHIYLYIPALLLLLLQPQTAVCEVFTALADMEGLVATELELVRHLDNYIQAEELRLQRLKG